MRRINLLPPEERRRGAAVTAPGGVLGVLLIAGGTAVLLMVGIYAFYLLRVGNQEEQIADLDRQIAEQNERLAELQPFRDLQARLEAKRPIADGIVRSRFAWDRFLQGLAFAIPPTTALTNLTAQAAPINIQAPLGEPLSPPGAATFTGVALPEYRNVSDFVVRMNTLTSVSNSELNLAELDRETFEEPAINFEVASELVTIVGEGGSELRIEGAQPTETSGKTPAEQASEQAARYPGEP